MTEPELVNAYVEYSSKSLVLVEREGEGVSFSRQLAEYSFSIDKKHVNQALYRQLMASKAVLSIDEDEEHYKIYWREADDCKTVCDRLADKGITTYDGGLSPVRRYLVDTGRKIGRPRRCFLDIETDSRTSFKNKEKARILCWVVVDAETRQEFRCVLDKFTNDSEKEVVSYLFEVLSNYDQVIAWNGDNFDFEVIKARARTLLPYIEMRRWLWLDHMVLFKRMNQMAAESGEEKQSYALENVAQSILGRGKNKFDSSKTYEAWVVSTPCESGDCMKCRQCLVDYCAVDTQLMPDIEEKKGFIELFQTLCDVCNVFPDTWGTNPTTQVEGFLLAIGKDRNYRFKSKTFVESTKYKGAYVLRPTKAGIMKNVHVFDYKSLYPSIIQTWNISPETLILHNEGDVRPDYACECPLTGLWFDQRVQGILPFAIGELLRLRKVWQDKCASLPPNTPEWYEANARSTAYKIAANSFYGVIGSAYSRFFNRDIAEAITQCGVWLVKKAAAAAENIGCSILAIDTDGGFCQGATKEEFETFVLEDLNKKMIPVWIESCGCTTNYIKVNYDKTFERLIIPIDSKKKPVSKKYAGNLASAKGTAATEDSKAEVKGLEYKRGDSLKFGRMMQKEIIDLLTIKKCEVPEPLIEVFKRYKNIILNEELKLEDIMLAKSLGKDIDAYEPKMKIDGTLAALPAHVQVGKVLLDRGQEVQEGVKIGYVIKDFKRKEYIPAEDFDGEVDRHKIWEGTWKPSERFVLAIWPDMDWSEFQKTRPKEPRKKRESKKDQQELITFLDDVDNTKN